MLRDRRQFLESLATGAVAVGGVALGLGALPTDLQAASLPVAPQGSAWATDWPAKLTGRVRTVFDVPEVESGYGVWRASVWAMQYQQVLGVPARDLSTALVLRHNAIALAMTQAFWDRYGVAEWSKATHPISGEPTKRSPSLMDATDGLGAPYSLLSLPQFMERGGVALACNLALAEMAGLVQQKDGVDAAEANRRAVAGLVPGVILQPSGIFAVLLAQQASQALYVRAS